MTDPKLTFGLSENASHYISVGIFFTSRSDPTKGLFALASKYRKYLKSGTNGMEYASVMEKDDGTSRPGGLQMTQITRNLIFVAIALLASISASAAFIEIQPFVICEDDGSNCAQSGFYEAETDKIWAQAGIDVNFLAMQQLNNTAWLDVNVGSGSVVAQETIDVMQAGAAINDSLTTLAINMFFVDFLDSSSGFYGLGCGADVFSVACAGEVGVFIAGNVFNTNRIDTIAHEIGHVLELFHVTTADRLMATGSTRTTPSTIDDITPDGLGLSVLTSAEIATALGSKFVQADTGETEVPEPSTLMLLLTGLLAFRFRKRSMA